MAEQDDSFEAANAIPGVYDEMDDDNEWERQVIDLDAPIPGAAPAVPPAAPAGMPAPTAEGVEPAAVSSKEVEELKAKVTEANQECLRARADLQNFRRRGEEERLRIIRDANERLIKELLPVLDDFDLALDAARKTESYEQLIGGVEAIIRKFQDTMGKQGVKPIPSVGEPFDAEVHEAVMLDEESEEPDETVTAELRKGYTLHDRVIRPALVKVAKKS
ncbi:MAG: nucleotide exchange factor GrpE [Armatimonadota bacterium]|nr:nucleotide exchange factor GrpE [Armatimonadota bacterium]